MKKIKAARRTAKKATNGMIDFNFANVSYQIDPNRRKVYLRWIEVETAKTCMIMSAFNQAHSGTIRKAV